MSSQGPNNAGSGAQGGYTGSGPGTNSWTNPSNVGSASSGSVATISLGASALSKSLDAYNWSFSVPAGATINGLEIQLTVENASAHLGTLNGAIALINGASGTPTTTTATGDTLTTSYAVYTWGSSTDLWGISSSDWTSALVNGATYSTDVSFSVWVKASAAGLTGFNIYNAQATVTYTVASPPSAPTGLTVTNDATNPTTVLDLSWTASSGATSYNVLQASTLAGTYTQVASGISGTSTTIPSLTSGTEYAFEVEAVGSGGTSSPSTAVAWATEAAAPTGLSGAVTSNSATVSFTGSSRGSTIVLDDYAYRYETPVGAANWVGGTGVSTSPITINGLTPGTQYGIELAPVIGSSNSDWAGSIQGPWSSELTVTTSGALPSRCNVIMARKIHSWTVKHF